jgi:hypothetical protein
LTASAGAEICVGRFGGVAAKAATIILKAEPMAPSSATP